MEAKTKGYKRLVGSSGGNAGLAMAYAANQLKMPLTLFIPKVCFSHNQGCLYIRVTVALFNYLLLMNVFFYPFMHYYFQSKLFLKMNETVKAILRFTYQIHLLM